MGISLVKYTTAQDLEPKWGVLKEQTIHPLNIKQSHHRDVMDIYYNQRSNFDVAIDANTLNSSEVMFHSPLSKHIQLFAQGLNYASHRDESGSSNKAKDAQNLFFYKSPSSICGPNDYIIRPKGCELLDYEVELGLVLKKDLIGETQVTKQNIGQYIGGLILCNDVSARDEQFGASMLQWFKGKSFRTFCPVGPVLYLIDEPDIDQIYNLDLQLKLNGEVKQQANTKELVHSPDKSLSDISEFADLSAGDCVLTGTPGGVLAAHSLRIGLSVILNLTNDKKRRDKFTAAQKTAATFLQPGDKLQLSLKSPDGKINLGIQKNIIKDA
jgi:2-keto-4-pentenoate hydratase/2-oxohepta-3-ene-1,7-dioic acid hydratase in catechol pathway